VFTIPCHGRCGGLALLWKETARVKIINYTQHHIDTYVHRINAERWRFYRLLWTPGPSTAKRILASSETSQPVRYEVVALCWGFQ
jgi:hypothetical protein